MPYHQGRWVVLQIQAFRKAGGSLSTIDDVLVHEMQNYKN